MDGSLLKHTALFALCFSARFCFGTSTGFAEDPDVSALLERIERLEAGNQQLQQKVFELESVVDDSGGKLLNSDSADKDHAESLIRPRGWIYTSTETETLFAGSDTSPLLTQSHVNEMVAAAISDQKLGGDTAASSGEKTLSAADEANARIERRIAELDKSFRMLQNKSKQKTYPNVTVNGVFQADAGWIHQDSASEAQYGQIQDGSNFRRARLSAKGAVTEYTNYFFQMDFGFFGRPTFTDVWVEQTKVPLFGNVRIGQWKQPFGLETVSSFRYTTFMERSVLFQPFTPFRHIGIGFYDHSDDLTMTWAASAFRTGQDQFGGTLSSDGGYGAAERVTFLPYWERKGESYLHVGMGHFLNAPPGDSVRFRTIPEFFVGANGPGAVGTSGQAVPGGSDGTPFFIDTTTLTGISCYNVLGTELLWVDGPVSVQSEAMVNMVNQGGGSTAALPGVYAQAGYFLTGEHRPYDRNTGTIDRVIPRSNLTFSGTPSNPGLGAVEVAGRWSYLDLNDSAIRGGTIMDYTAGVNWYWNPYTKMVFNYVHAIPDTVAFPKSHTDFFGVRAQLDF